MPRPSNSTNPTGHVWTETRMLKLCVLAIKQSECQPSLLADLWVAAYPNEEFQPTAKAITHKIAKMKNSVGVKSSDGSKPKQTARTGPTTPKKRGTPKDFDSSGSSKQSKKSEEFNFSEDDDEELMGSFPSPCPDSKIKRETN